jgi:pimeloyl-ACP methyl ester carboxylesterase
MTLAVRPWGFEMTDLDFPILCFQGKLDTLNPVKYGRFLWESLPNCELKLFPDDGHFSLFYRHYHEILESVVG